jgi:hypothetical protein
MRFSCVTRPSRGQSDIDDVLRARDGDARVN